MNWAVEEIFQKIWLDETWSKCAKGGNHPENKSFEKHRDMGYQVHIFSGTAMAMRVLDFSYTSNTLHLPENELLVKLKRSILGYLFHDFNKLTGSDYHMQDKSALNDLIDTSFGDLTKEIGLNNDNIYQIAICTEKGTSFNILRNDVSTSPLEFEMNFSRLADVLSGSFNDLNDEPLRDISFGPKVIISGRDIGKIKISNTNLVAITDLLKKSCIKMINEDFKGTYLWSDYDTIYYVFGPSKLSKNEINAKILEKFSNYVSLVMRPERLLTLNDRRVDNAASGFIDHSEDSMIKFLSEEKNIRMCIHLEDIKLDSPYKQRFAEEYGDYLLDTYPCASFSINFRFTKEKEGGHSIRDSLKVNDYDERQDNERLNIFLIRYVQLVSELQSKSAQELRELIDHTISENKGKLSHILGKEPKKSVLIFPILLKSNSIDWKQLLIDVLQNLNKNSKSVDYTNVVPRILSSLFTDISLPNVPNKFSMSMVNGYPAKEDAKGDKLYGLNTNGFNNRLPTSRISFGKIDDISMLEYNIRRNIIPERLGNGTLIYLRFPGAIPHLDVAGFIHKISRSKQSERVVINWLDLSIDQFGEEPNTVRVDDSFFFTTPEIKKEEDILRQLYDALTIAQRTKMTIRVSYSNAPVFEDQFESVRVDLSSNLLAFFSWDRIRCNQISNIIRTIQTFNVVSNGSIEKINFTDTYEVISSYMQNPMSIFYYVHRRVFAKEGKSESRGFGKQFSQRIEDIKKLGYGEEKKGDRKMKNIEELAKTASKIAYANWKMSGNDRTWMLRDPLEAIEVARAKIVSGEKRDLDEYKDIVGGVLNTKLRREKSDGNSNWIPIGEIEKFSEILIRMLKEDFKGQVPSGAMKSYLINAFEFEYMLTIGKKGDINE